MNKRIWRYLTVLSIVMVISLVLTVGPVTAQTGEKQEKTKEKKELPYKKVETKGKPDIEKKETLYERGKEKRETIAPYGVPRTDLEAVPSTAPMAKAGGTGVYDVGVIPHTASCPSGSELITIRMDDEDNNNNNSHWGWIGAIYQTTNTKFRFCKVDGTLFKPLSERYCEDRRLHYAVLKLGSTCPPGSSEFSRYFDNEDDDNNNYYSGNIYPNYSGKNTRLYFCLFRSGWTTMSDFPDLGISYGVFAPTTFTKVLYSDFGSLYTDDEDSDNNNNTSVSNDLWSDAYRIVHGTSNTRLYMARVK